LFCVEARGGKELEEGHMEVRHGGLSELWGRDRGRDGLSGAKAVEFYTLTPKQVRKYRSKTSEWGKVLLGGHDKELASVRDQAGFELIAEALGIPRPQRDT
jgi:hypothetical protein